MTCKCACGCPLTLLPFEQRTQPAGICAYCTLGNHDHGKRDGQ